MIKIEYVRQQGPDCVVKRDGARTVIPNCDARKLENTLKDKLGVRYTHREMYKYGFIARSNRENPGPARIITWSQ